MELSLDPSDNSLERACEVLVRSRPTAVNLPWAVRRVRAAVSTLAPAARAQRALAEAVAIQEEEEVASAAIATAGADLLDRAEVVLTHCNTGALAAPGGGTALAVVTELFARGGLRSVLVTETRPLLQGARLTTYELRRLGIPYELIVDGAAAGLMAGGQVDAVVVGCDRVAANGDVANKVGTYPLALGARAAGIPFAVAGPTSTIDPECPSGRQIMIEERAAEEIRHAGSSALTPPETSCRNPAFDVTPAELVSALITERGTAQPVTSDSVRRLSS